FFTAPATTEIYTLSLHDALPISVADVQSRAIFAELQIVRADVHADLPDDLARGCIEDTHVTWLRIRASIGGIEQILFRMHCEARSEEHTSELQSRGHLVCRLLLE